MVRTRCETETVRKRATKSARCSLLLLPSFSSSQVKSKNWPALQSSSSPPKAPRSRTPPHHTTRSRPSISSSSRVYLVVVIGQEE